MFQAGLLPIIRRYLFCIYSNWYMSCIYVDWLLGGSEWSSKFQTFLNRKFIRQMCAYLNIIIGFIYTLFFFK